MAVITAWTAPSTWQHYILLARPGGLSAPTLVEMLRQQPMSSSACRDYCSRERKVHLNCSLNKLCLERRPAAYITLVDYGGKSPAVDWEAFRRSAVGVLSTNKGIQGAEGQEQSQGGTTPTLHLHHGSPQNSCFSKMHLHKMAVERRYCSAAVTKTNSYFHFL